MKVFDYVQIPEELYEKVSPTGSSYICNPPVKDTDIDFIVLSPDWNKLDTWLVQHGFKTNFEDYELEEFRSYKRNTINLIITDDPMWFKRMHKATELAKQLNLLDKQQRINLFDFVMYECNLL